MYITQQLKNNKDRRRTDKRVSSILIKQKIYSHGLDTIQELQKEDQEFDEEPHKTSNLFSLKRYNSERADSSSVVPTAPK